MVVHPTIGILMHPIVVLVPALALVVGPRLWVGHVLKQHNRRDEDFPGTAGDLARELLDRHGLQVVKVESTDMGDHYDPVAKSVRLSRDKFDRKTLTALTTAAHEVAHALQDASGYGPFVWRNHLVKVAQRAGELGAVLFLSVPLAAIFSRNPVPPVVIGVAALAMLGTGVVAQMAALPSELEASFGRALPMLRDGYINEQQGQDAHKILLACSLTYVASSLVAILYIWPWIGRPVFRQPVAGSPRALGLTAQARGRPHHDQLTPSFEKHARTGSTIALAPRRAQEHPLRRGTKTLIRCWLRLTSSF